MAAPSVGLVPDPTSSSRTRVDDPSDLECSTIAQMSLSLVTWELKVERLPSRLWLSPMSARTLSKNASLAPQLPPVGRNRPHFAMCKHNAMVFMEAVLPPVLGPLMVSTRQPFGTEMSTGVTPLGLPPSLTSDPSEDSKACSNSTGWTTPVRAMGSKASPLSPSSPAGEMANSGRIPPIHAACFALAKQVSTSTTWSYTPMMSSAPLLILDVSALSTLVSSFASSDLNRISSLFIGTQNLGSTYTVWPVLLSPRVMAPFKVPDAPCMPLFTGMQYLSLLKTTCFSGTISSSKSVAQASSNLVLSSISTSLVRSLISDSRGVAPESKYSNPGFTARLHSRTSASAASSMASLDSVYTPEKTCASKSRSINTCCDVRTHAHASSTHVTHASVSRTSSTAISVLVFVPTVRGFCALDFPSSPSPAGEGSGGRLPTILSHTETSPRASRSRSSPSTSALTIASPSSYSAPMTAVCASRSFASPAVFPALTTSSRPIKSRSFAMAVLANLLSCLNTRGHSHASKVVRKRCSPSR
mmetsp:Transcript_2275/g.8214  ORF Transcript_2275/g.8214 Transcript_2275/m.8214 type:complete len:529 (-) Transcript_2275:390-1976(-)